MLNKRKYVRSFFQATRGTAREIDEASLVAVVSYIFVFFLPRLPLRLALALCAVHKLDAPLLSLLTLYLRIFSGQLWFFLVVVVRRHPHPHIWNAIFYFIRGFRTNDVLLPFVEMAFLTVLRSRSTKFDGSDSLGLVAHLVRGEHRSVTASMHTRTGMHDWLWCVVYAKENDARTLNARPQICVRDDVLCCVCACVCERKSLFILKMMQINSHLARNFEIARNSS